jgi:hypothetical protein
MIFPFLYEVEWRERFCMRVPLNQSKQIICMFIAR